MSDGKNGFEKNKHNFPYKWTLKDAVFTKDKGKVFSCFACGGGSTMGYKLAGFDVLGCNEIDPKMIEAYKANHKPTYLAAPFLGRLFCCYIPTNSNKKI